MKTQNEIQFHLQLPAVAVSTMYAYLVVFVLMVP